MFRAKFDRVISIGEQCGCALYLRKHFLRFASYPLDWIGGPDFGTRVDLITRRFAGFLEREDLVFSEVTPDMKHDVWVNKVTGFHFVHDFDHGKAMDEAFPEVKRKYDRRIERFFRHIDAARRVLLVYWSRDKMVPAEELVPAQQRLSRFFGKDVYLLVIQHDATGGVMGAAAKLSQSMC